MIRLLVLQQLYNLPDDALEFQVLDHGSFLRFLALERSARTPDVKTVWVEGERLKRYALIGEISASVSGQLQRAEFLTNDDQISTPSSSVHRSSAIRVMKVAVLPAARCPRTEAGPSARRKTSTRWTCKHGKHQCEVQIAGQCRSALHSSRGDDAGIVQRHGNVRSGAGSS
jgi:IS5 family transposase